jgi:formate hydrogenlyase subunit 6/NADH:ubiquinone oxidoreductase subunit I
VSATAPDQFLDEKKALTCVHCGLCAERCPTAAWDMQKSFVTWPHAKDEAAADLSKLAAEMPKSA